MDRITKLAHFLAVWMTFTLEELCRLYICEIVRYMSASLYHIGQGSQIYNTLLEKFPKSHGDTVDDEHNISSSEKWSVRVDHIDFREHAACMCPGS